jgi:hypothetical protein
MAATARAVDLTDASQGGNFRTKRVPSGDYRAKIVKADDHQPNDKSKPMGWVITVQLEGYARNTYPFYLSPEKKQAWKIAQVCRAAGLKVPSGRVRFDPNKLINKSIGVAMEDDEYEGRPKSVIDEMFPVSEVGANADEGVPEDEDIDIQDDVEIPEDDEPEEDEPEPEPVKPVRRRKPAPEPEPEPEDDEEEDEDEEEPPPPPKRRRATPPPAKKAAAPRRRAAAPPADEEDDLDLDDLDEE